MCVALAVAAACAQLAGCGGESDRELVVKAQQLLDKNDVKGAVIQLKNALQKNSNSGDARLLLGRALLESGNPADAVLELDKALEAGQDKNRVMPVLARALVYSGQQKKLLDKYASTQLKIGRAHV